MNKFSKIIIVLGFLVLSGIVVYQSVLIRKANDPSHLQLNTDRKMQDIVLENTEKYFNGDLKTARWALNTIINNIEVNNWINDDYAIKMNFLSTCRLFALEKRAGNEKEAQIL
jgi:hypothetical protein